MINLINVITSTYVGLSLLCIIVVGLMSKKKVTCILFTSWWRYVNWNCTNLISQFAVSSCANRSKWPLIFFIRIGTSIVFKFKASLPNLAIHGIYIQTKNKLAYSNVGQNDSRIRTWGIVSIALNAVPRLFCYYSNP